MWGSQSRPGMRGNASLGSLAGNTLAGSTLAGDTLGARVYTLEPLGGDAAGSRMAAYGLAVADKLVGHAKTYPKVTRVAAMRQAMAQIDPTLFARTNAIATKLRAQGVDAATALHRAIAQASVDGLMSQLHQIGTSTSPAQATELTQLGYLGGTEPLGIWGLSWVAEKVSSVFTPVATATQEAGTATVHGVKSVLGAIKDLACGVVQGGGASAAAQAAASAPSPQTVGVAAGAQVASQLCGPAAAAPVAPPPEPSNLPIYIAAGGAGLLVLVALATRKR